MKSRSSVCLTFVTVASAMLGAGCQSPPQTRTITAADSGSTIQLKTGDLLEVKLESNATTGYTWQTIDVNSWVLARLTRPEYQPTGATGPDGTPLMGAGGTLTLTFRAVGPGTSPLKFGYLRPWEVDVVAAKTFEVTVVVR
ncbi:MAG TPA: protease inhibitor I42 family protein [Verrucomicrobiota bacterium]|nr:hypothetical protein [Verrucomicrobiales bacterium]HRI15244.1 protease inhibitor I42 family protein [Verrucomicrobiota bacterium]